MGPQTNPYRDASRWPQWVLRRHENGKTTVYHHGIELIDATNVAPPAAVDALERRAALMDRTLEVVIDDVKENTSQVIYVSKNGARASKGPDESVSEMLGAQQFLASSREWGGKQPQHRVRRIAPVGVQRGLNLLNPQKRLLVGVSGGLLLICGLVSLFILAVNLSPRDSISPRSQTINGGAYEGEAATSKQNNDDFGQDLSNPDRGNDASEKDSEKTQDRSGPSRAEQLEQLEKEFNTATTVDEGIPIGAGRGIYGKDGKPLQPTDPNYPTLQATAESPEPSATESGPQTDQLEVFTESDVRSIAFFIYAYGPSSDYGNNGPRPEILLTDTESKQVFAQPMGLVVAEGYFLFIGIEEVPAGVHDYVIKYDGHVVTGKVQAY